MYIDTRKMKEGKPKLYSQGLTRRNTLKKLPEKKLFEEM